MEMKGSPPMWRSFQAEILLLRQELFFISRGKTPGKVFKVVKLLDETGLALLHDKLAELSDVEEVGDEPYGSDKNHASAHYQDPIIPVAHFSEGDLEQSQKSDDYQDDPQDDHADGDGTSLLNLDRLRHDRRHRKIAIQYFGQHHIRELKSVEDQVLTGSVGNMPHEDE